MGILLKRHEGNGLFESLQCGEDGLQGPVFRQIVDGREGRGGRQSGREERSKRRKEEESKKDVEEGDEVEKAW